MNKERYNRQIMLQGFGMPAQMRLTGSAVLVIGAGGLGCPALQYLAAAGIGTIGIVDDDVVLLSNLHRQVLFTTEDIGKLKVEIAAKRLQQMNPEISINTYAVKIDKSNVVDILNHYDVILDGTDNFAARYLINDACTLLHKPLIFAAVSGYEGQLAVFNVPDNQNESTNYRDIFPVQPKEGEIPNCAENGVLGVLPGVIGTMAATEVIKFITKTGTPLINKLRHYNILSGEQYEINVSPANHYTLPKTATELLKMEYEDSCKVSQNYIEIDAKELKSLQNQPSTLIIDVRERHEFPKLNDPFITQVPMSELDELLKQNITQNNIVFICQHGIRSVAAAEAFNEKYGDTKKTYSLKGGIVKWRNHF